jgi:hypothetical protein
MVKFPQAAVDGHDPDAVAAPPVFHPMKTDESTPGDDGKKIAEEKNAAKVSKAR